MCYMELKDRFACVDTPLKLLNLDILSDLFQIREIDEDLGSNLGYMDHGAWG